MRNRLLKTLAIGSSMFIIMNANAAGYYKDKVMYEPKLYAGQEEAIISVLPTAGSLIKVQSYDHGYHYVKVVGQSKGRVKVKPLSIGDREYLGIQTTNLVPFAR